MTLLVGLCDLVHPLVRILRRGMLKANLSELKTLEWWISRSMLDLLVLLNPRLGEYAFDIQERSLKFNQSACRVKMCTFNF